MPQNRFEETEDVFGQRTVSIFFDSNGKNEELRFKRSITTDLDGSNTTEKSTNSAMLTLKPRDTGLLLVQPDPTRITKPLNTSEIELRGHVEVTQLKSDEEGFGVARVLLTPEHRGTFYSLDIPTLGNGEVDRTQPVTLPKEQQLDQIAYALPTATGSSLFELS